MKFPFVLGCMCIPFISLSQCTLSGTITDKKSHEPLEGVTIYIHDLKTGAATDRQGQYHIDHLPKGRFLIEISYPTYRSVTGNVSINGNTDYSKVIEPTVAEFNEVVVTGTSRATDIRRNPLSVVTLSTKTTNLSVQTNLVDALTTLPGISAISTGPNISKPVIRGLSTNRVLTLYNGIRQEGQQWGDEHGIEIDEYAIERAEIIKGPASLSYGSDAMAGVVNLLSPKPLEKGKIKGGLLSGYQTNNGLISFSAHLAGNTNNVIWGGRFSRKVAGNYTNAYDGKVYGTSFSEYDASGYAGINGKKGSSQIHFTLYDNNQSVPDGSRDSSSRKFTRQVNEADTLREIVPASVLNAYGVPDLHQHIQHYRLYLTNHLLLPSGFLQFNLGYQESVRKEYEHPEFTDIPGLWLQLRTYTYDLRYHFPEWKHIDVTSGINGMIQTNTNKGTAFIIPDYSLTDVGPFLIARASMNRVELSAGIRYDLRLFNNKALYTAPDPHTGLDVQVDQSVATEKPFDAQQYTFSGFTGSAGASFAINQLLSLKANIGRGFRAPNIAELSSNGVHPGTNIYQIGNTHFLPEFSLQEDIGLFYTDDHVSGSIELFHNQISHFIYNEKVVSVSGIDSTDGNGNTYFRYNQVSARLYGGEATLDIHPHPLDWLHLENSFSMVYGNNQDNRNDSSRYLPQIPPFRWRSEIRTDFRKLSPRFSYLYMKIELDYQAAQNRVMLAYGTETATPGYTLIHAGIGGDISDKKGAILFSLYFVCANVFDVTYQSHLSRLKYMDDYPENHTGRSGIYNPGRNFSVKLIIPFTLH